MASILSESITVTRMDRIQLKHDNISRSSDYAMYKYCPFFRNLSRLPEVDSKNWNMTKYHTVVAMASILKMFRSGFALLPTLM